MNLDDTSGRPRTPPEAIGSWSAGSHVEPGRNVSRLLDLALSQEQEHAVVLLDRQGRVLEWFAGAARLFGYGRAEMVGDTLRRLYTPEDLERGQAEWTLEAATAYGRADVDRWQVRKDGVRVWVSAVTTALHELDGSLAGFMSVARDRTDLKGQLESLQNRVDEAARAEKDMHALLGTLAHELRNPLGQISNAAHLVGALSRGDPEAQASIGTIHRQVRFIARVLEDLLEATRVAVGKAKLHYETVELRRVVDGAIESCGAALAARAQSVNLLLPPSLPVELDPVRIQQVLVNLVSNSSKFSPPGTPIFIKAHVEGEALVLRVEDQGEGIPPELLPRIFELFTQAGASGAAGDGLGLGLGVVKAIVELHGGTVQARSEGGGRGTELIVRLPLRRP